MLHAATQVGQYIVQNGGSGLIRNEDAAFFEDLVKVVGPDVTQVMIGEIHIAARIRLQDRVERIVRIGAEDKAAIDIF